MNAISTRNGRPLRYIMPGTVIAARYHAVMITAREIGDIYRYDEEGL